MGLMRTSPTAKTAKTTTATTTTSVFGEQREPQQQLRHDDDDNLDGDDDLNEYDHYHPSSTSTSSSSSIDDLDKLPFVRITPSDSTRDGRLTAYLRSTFATFFSNRRAVDHFIRTRCSLLVSLLLFMQRVRTLITQIIQAPFVAVSTIASNTSQALQAAASRVASIWTPAEYQERIITLHPQHDITCTPRYFPPNVVCNQKYSVYTFLPLFLYSQFRFFFNLYFLLVALTQFIPILQVGFLFTYVAPLVFVLIVTMLKEAHDDVQRWKRDREANSQSYTRINVRESRAAHSLVTESVASAHIHVGDLIVLHTNSRIPADMVLLRTHDKQGSVFIRTDQLDGETDWKLRNAVRCTQILPDDVALLSIAAELHAEAPHKQVYQFSGTLTFESSDPYSSTSSSSSSSSSSSCSSSSSSSSSSTPIVEALSLEHTLWTNTVLASGTVIGLVVYTGKETRSVMNANQPRNKVGALDHELNYFSKVLFAITISMAAVLVLLKGLHGQWYIYFFRFILLFSAIIPISLRVNLDMGKTVYSMMMMRDSEIAGTVVRSSTIPEELGRISYLFSDKTGTLTRNVMAFKVLQMEPPVMFNKQSVQALKQYLRNSFRRRRDLPAAAATSSSDVKRAAQEETVEAGNDRPARVDEGEREREHDDDDVDYDDEEEEFNANEMAALELLRDGEDDDGQDDYNDDDEKNDRDDDHDGQLFVNANDRFRSSTSRPLSTLTSIRVDRGASGSDSSPRQDMSASSSTSPLFPGQRRFGSPRHGDDNASDESSVSRSGEYYRPSVSVGGATAADDLDLEYGEGVHVPAASKRSNRRGGGYNRMMMPSSSSSSPSSSSNATTAPNNARTRVKAAVKQAVGSVVDAVVSRRNKNGEQHRLGSIGGGGAARRKGSDDDSVELVTLTTAGASRKQRHRRPSDAHGQANVHAGVRHSADQEVEQDLAEEAMKADQAAQAMRRQYAVAGDASSADSISPVETMVRNLVSALAICHNVTPVFDDSEEDDALLMLDDAGSSGSSSGSGSSSAVTGGRWTYQAASPDEVALVQFTEELGLRLSHRDQVSLTLTTPIGTEEQYDVLCVFPFTSETKRMGIIVRRRDTGRIVFYLKGAESIVKTKINPSDWLEEEVDNLARVGLRTLVFASRELSDQEYADFARRYAAAKATIKDRDAQVLAAIQTLEHHMDLLGLTGVEDKLQHGVKSTLETLRNAGVHVWMLTGDKAETATCIGISARLIDRNQDVYQFSASTIREAARHLDQFGTKINTCLVIDGFSLQLCLDNFQTQFLELACQAPSVICCRCSPTQKAQIVELMKMHTGKCTAAIGDGGNDVSMILAADVGLGIVGKEGKQASLAADFSLTQFSHVCRLMLWHGRNSYKRSARLSQFVIHRGLVISIIQAVFSALFFYAAIPIYNGWLVVGYATFYTMCPVFSLVLDEDVDAQKVFLYPELYKDLQKGRPLNKKTFWAWVLKSLYQGSVIMVLAMALFESNFLSIVSITFTALILSELVNVALEIHRWHRYMVASLIASVLIYLISIFVLKSYFDVTFIMTTNFAAKVSLITTISCLPPALGKILQTRFAPAAHNKVSDS